MPTATALARIEQLVIPDSQICLLRKQERRFELLHVQVEQDGTEALFFAREDSLITSRFPGFEKKLLQLLPNLLDNVQCFNGQNHHFATEMLATEMGHLFEHIWLEVLCCEKARISAKATYAGETTWDWHDDPRGLFRIHLSAGIADRELVERSAAISSLILDRALSSVKA